MKPNVHPMSKERNTLRVIFEICDAHDIDLISWTLALHNHYLERHYPACALLDVLGDRNPGSLCPANPQVREFMKALGTDLDVNYNLARIAYVSLNYGGYWLRNYAKKIGVDLGLVGSYLMALCSKRTQRCGSWMHRNKTPPAAKPNSAARRLIERTPMRS